eukprot:CFRG8187T1
MAAVASAHVDSAILIVLSTRFTQCFAILDEDSSLGWKCCEDILQHSGYNADMADKVKAVVGKALRKAFGAELRWKKYRRSDGSRRNLYSLKPIDPWPIVNPPAIMYGLMSTCTGTVNDNRKLADNPRSSPKFSDPPKHYNSEYSRGDSQARYRQNHTTYEDNFDPYYKFSGQPEYTRSTTAMNPRHHASERESERSTGTSAVRYENFGLLNETMLPWDTNRQIHPGSRYYTASNHYESRQGRLDWKRPQPRHDVYTGTNLDTDNVQFDLRRPNITLSHVHTSQSQQQEARTGVLQRHSDTHPMVRGSTLTNDHILTTIGLQCIEISLKYLRVGDNVARDLGSVSGDFESDKL